MRVTVKEFAEKVGLGEDFKDYVGAGVMLRLLKSRGLATEVKGGRQGNRGRPKQVYEVSESVYEFLRTSGKPDLLVDQKAVEVKVVEEPEKVEEPATASPLFHWDDDEE